MKTFITLLTVLCLASLADAATIEHSVGDSLTYTADRGLPAYIVVEVEVDATPTTTNMRTALQAAIDHAAYDTADGIVIQLNAGEYRTWLPSDDAALVAALADNTATGAYLTGQSGANILYSLRISRPNTIIHGAGKASTTINVMGIDNNDPETSAGWVAWPWPGGKTEFNPREISTITEVSKATHGAGTYFTFTVAGLSGTTTDYYLWYDTTGSDTDPAPAGTGIRANISGDTSAEDVAATVTAAINAGVTQPGPDADLAAVDGAVITLTNAVGGNVTDIGNGDADSTTEKTTDGLALGITRGGGILLRSAADTGLPGCQMHDFTITGNCDHSGIASKQWPPQQSNGWGWAFSHKAVYGVDDSDGCFFENVDFIRFRGEIIYRDRGEGLWTFTNCVFEQSDSVPLSLNASCSVINCTVGENCFNSGEFWCQIEGQSMTLTGNTFYGGPAITNMVDTASVILTGNTFYADGTKLVNDQLKIDGGVHNVLIADNTFILDTTNAQVSAGILIRGSASAQSVTADAALYSVPHISNVVIENNTVTVSGGAINEFIKLEVRNDNAVQSLVVRNNTITGGHLYVVREQWLTATVDYTNDPTDPLYEDARWDYDESVDHNIWIYGNTAPSTAVYLDYGLAATTREPFYGFTPRPRTMRSNRKGGY